MSPRKRAGLRLFGWAAFSLVVFGLVAPYLSVDIFTKRLQASLERALGGKRRVEISGVHFSLFKGPGLSVDSVTIREDPAIGAEPLVYIQSPGSLEVAPRLSSLLGGRFVIASIRLDGASINLTKSGPASEWGQWNFASFVDRSVMSSAPAILVRNSRINFKFGNTKSVFYLTETDLDIAPPTPGSAGWQVECAAKAARTDRPAQTLGAFTIKGHWYLAPERVDLDAQLERTGLGEVTALLRGQAGGVHGTVSAQLHIAGPLNKIGITGRLTVEDVHRWDLLPPQGEGWPLDVRGSLDLAAQRLDLESSSARDVPLPLKLTFSAQNYLSKPTWNAAAQWNQFPAGPLLELVRHMGAPLPERLQLSGTVDGLLEYSGQGDLRGGATLSDAALTIPDSPPLKFERAYIVAAAGHAKLSPTLVRTSEGPEARVEADYDFRQNVFDLAISTDAMPVAALRAQVALAAVPWLEQVASGQWSGLLRYHTGEDRSAWTGRLQLKDAEVPVPGLTHPAKLSTATADLNGARVSLRKVEGSLGPFKFTGEYDYDPKLRRPHRINLRLPEADAADLETELAPTLRRSGLLARALGRTAPPAWLKERQLEGNIQIDDLAVGGSHMENLHAHIVWDSVQAQLESLRATLGDAALSGRFAVNVKGAQPGYTFSGTLKGLPWQDGKVDLEGKLETSGMGRQLLANLSSVGVFLATGVTFGDETPVRAVDGSYSLEWWQSAPRVRLTSLNLRTEDETFTGRGGTQDDGRLVVILTGRGREIRMSGILPKLTIEELAR